MKFIALIIALAATEALAVKTVTTTETVTSPKTCPRTVTVTSPKTCPRTVTVTRPGTKTRTTRTTVTTSTTVTFAATTTETDTTTVTDTVPGSGTATETTTSTTTTTTDGTPAGPTASAFSGKGTIGVYPVDTGMKKGFLISNGNWYAGGGSAATYTGATVDEAAGTFNLTTSKGPCAVTTTDMQFLCGPANTVGDLFTQNSDGDLTYAGSDVFYAAATATGTTQQMVYAVQSAVAINLQIVPSAAPSAA